ncbi:hypothetical protein J6590_061315 [Homalodisca vitripennis]|nr:hypothetical protein J6590_061315 [Homalodisca vitripennis]
MRSLTPDCKRPESGSAGISLLNHSVDRSPYISPLLSQLYNRKSFSDSASQTEDGHMKTKDELIERIDQLTHQQSCLVLQCQTMHVHLEEKEIRNLKNACSDTPKLAESTMALHQNDKERNESCQRCVILREEAQNMVQAIRTLESENLRLQNTLQERIMTERCLAVDSSIDDSEGSQRRSSLPLSNSSPFLSEKQSQISDCGDFF